MSRRVQPGSPDPDATIREVVRSGRSATEEEVAAIAARIATAPFNSALVHVRVADRGVEYLGYRLGEQAHSLTLHLIRRVVTDRQWSHGTTADELLGDLRSAARAAQVRLAVYRRHGGMLAVAVAPTAEVVPPARLGPEPQPNVLVVYSADLEAIVTGYQFSSLDAVDIPQDARWLE